VHLPLLVSPLHPPRRLLLFGWLWLGIQSGSVLLGRRNFGGFRLRDQ